METVLYTSLNICRYEMSNKIFEKRKKTSTIWSIPSSHIFTSPYFIPGFPKSFQLQRYWSNIRWSAFQSLGEWRNQFRFLLFQYRIIAHPLGWSNGRIPLRFDKQSLGRVGRVVGDVWSPRSCTKLGLSLFLVVESSRHHRGTSSFSDHFGLRLFQVSNFCAQFPSLVSKSLLNEKNVRKISQQIHLHFLHKNKIKSPLKAVFHKKKTNKSFWGLFLERVVCCWLIPPKNSHHRGAKVSRQMGLSPCFRSWERTWCGVATKAPPLKIWEASPPRFLERFFNALPLHCLNTHSFCVHNTNTQKHRIPP